MMSSLLEVRRAHVTGPSAVASLSTSAYASQAQLQLQTGSNNVIAPDGRIFIISTPSSTSTNTSTSTSSAPREQLCRIFEASSGLLQATIALNNCLGNVDKSTPFCGTHVIAIDSERGIFSFYSTTPPVKRLQIPFVLRAPLKMGQRVTQCCPTRERDRMMFFTVSATGQQPTIENTSLHALLFPYSDPTSTPTGLVSQPLSVDLTALLQAVSLRSNVNQSSVQPGHIAITTITCHPTKPLLLVGLSMPNNINGNGSPNSSQQQQQQPNSGSTACVALWSYAQYRRRLAAKLAGRKATSQNNNANNNDNNEDDDSDAMNDDDNDGDGPNNNGGNDAASDAGSVASRTSSVASSAVGGMRGFFHRMGRASKTPDLPLRTVLLPPKGVVSSNGIGLTASFVTMGHAGSLTAVVWSERIVSVYDTRLRNQTAVTATNAASRPMTISGSEHSSSTGSSYGRPGLTISGQQIGSKGSSINRLTVANVGQMAAANVSTVPQVYPTASLAVSGLCHSLGFHPMEPVLVIATNGVAGPKVALLSLLDGLLTRVGEASVALMLGLDTERDLICNTPEPGTFIVQLAGCIDHTGHIVLQVASQPQPQNQNRIIGPIAGIGPDGLSNARAALASAAMSTSKSTPNTLDGGVGLLMVVCAIGSEYQSTRAALLSPVISSVSVPSQAYIEGPDKALLRFHSACAPRSDSASITDSSNSNSNSNSNVNGNPTYPMVLAIRPVLDISESDTSGSDDVTSVAPLTVTYHLFQVNLRLGTTLTADLARNAGQSECLFQHLGVLPATVEGPVIVTVPAPTKPTANTATTLEDLLDFSAPVLSTDSASSSGRDDDGSKWLRVPDEDGLPAGLFGRFTPLAVKPNEQALTAVATGTIGAEQTPLTGWTALVKGHIQYRNKATDGKAQSGMMAAVCFTRYTCSLVRPANATLDSFAVLSAATTTSPTPTSAPAVSTQQLQHVLAVYRDADFWTGASASARAVSADYPEGVLAIESTGHRVKWLRLQASTQPTALFGKVGPESSSQVLATWPMPAGITAHKLWTSPLGAPNFVAYLCSGEASEPPSVLLVSPRGSAVPTSTSLTVGILLSPGESVVELQWQPAISGTGATTDVSSMTMLWQPPVGCSCLLGLVTNQRALIARARPDGSLIVANELNLHSSSSASTSCVHSISWAGLALVLARDSGAVEYLLPSRPHADSSGKIAVARQLIAGQYAETAAGTGRIASLGRHVAQAGLRVVCCLPDRFLLASLSLSMAVSTSNVASPLIQLHCRPWVPVEPVMLASIAVLQESVNAKPTATSTTATTQKPSDLASLLSQPVTGTEAGAAPAGSAGIVEALATLSSRFFHSSQRLSGATADQQATEGGASPSGHATPRLLVALLEAGLGVEAVSAVVAGFRGDDSSTVSTSSVSAFPAMRWLHPSLQFSAAMDLQPSLLPAEITGSALFASRPDLLERFQDPDSYGSGMLPHRRSLAARQCAAAARVMSNRGKADLSKRLADLAGDDAAVAALISSTNGSDANADLRAFAETLSDRAPALQRAIYLQLQQQSTGPVAASSASSVADTLISVGSPIAGQMSLLVDGPDPLLAVKRAFDSSRRNTMFMLKGNAALKDLPASIPLQIDRGTTISAAVRTVDEKFKKRVWPLESSLGHMALDRLEDWIGMRTKPEGIAPRSSQLGSLLAQALAGGQTRDDGEGEGSSSGIGAGRRRDGLNGAQAASITWPGGLTSKPPTWCDDAGLSRSATTKEHEKVSGYWRFSDLIAHGERGDSAASSVFKYVNSGHATASTLATILDLSKHQLLGHGFNCLELFCSSNTSSTGVVAVESTSSNVDPGEDHDKVKSLNDIVVMQALAPASSIVQPGTGLHAEMRSGLRVLVGRGGPLDTGPCHVDPDRSKLTIEMTVRVIPTSLAQCGSACYLIRRLTGSPSSSSTSPGDAAQSLSLYSLLIEPSGTLVLSVGPGSSGSTGGGTLRSPEGLMLNPQAVLTRLASNGGNDDDDIDSSSQTNNSNSNSNSNSSASLSAGNAEWLHVAVVFDFSKSAQPPPTAGNARQDASVQLFVNGQRVARGTLTLSPTHNAAELEPLLATSTLYLAANMPTGSRVTELRCWADIRTGTEIEEQRENYLPLASKRKRQQLRVKGTKEVFQLAARDCADLTAALSEAVSELPAMLPDLCARGDDASTTSSGSGIGASSGAPVRPSFLGPAANLKGVLPSPTLSLSQAAGLKPPSSISSSDGQLSATSTTAPPPRPLLGPNTNTLGAPPTIGSLPAGASLSSAAAKRKALAATLAQAAASANASNSSNTSSANSSASLSAAPTTISTSSIDGQHNPDLSADTADKDN